jgi:hypothetical protein
MAWRGMAWLERLRAVTMLAVAAFAISSAVQTGCGGTEQGVPPSPEGGVTCGAGQTPLQLGTHGVCCTAGAPVGALSCVQPGEVNAGMPCSTVGATTQGDGFEAVLDQCVTESCSGDRTSASYPSQTRREQGTLVCQGSAGSSTWQWQGGVQAQHVVIRSCNVTGHATCSGASYGYEYDGYGCPTGPAGHPQCVYGYYDGPASVPVRQVQVASSACSDAQGNVSPCPAGDL